MQYEVIYKSISSVTDKENFCKQVTEKLNDGFELHGSLEATYVPSTSNGISTGGYITYSQAMVKKD